MKAYSPHDPEGFNSIRTGDVAPGSDTPDALDDNDVLGLTGTGGDYSATPGQEGDYDYNPSVAMADTIDADGGRAAVQTSDESGATAGGGYSFGSSAEADDTGDATGDTEAIRSDIEQTRSEMSATIDAIQDRLNPQTLVDQAKDTVREATIGRVENMVSDARDTVRETSSGLLETMKQNPLPAALAAIGIGWLFMKSRSNPNQGRYDYGYRGPEAYPSGRAGYDSYGYNRARYDYGNTSGRPGEGIKDKVGDAAGQVTDTIKNKAQDAGGTVSDAAGQVRDAAGNVVDTVQEKAGDLGSNVQYGAWQAQNQFQRMIYENPLAVGAAALVAGAAIGMLIPETEQEHKLMGEARDNVLDKAQDVANQALDKVQNVAQRAGDAAQQAAQEQGITP